MKKKYDKLRYLRSPLSIYDAEIYKRNIHELDRKAGRVHDTIGISAIIINLCCLLFLVIGWTDIPMAQVSIIIAIVLVSTSLSWIVLSLVDFLVLKFSAVSLVIDGKEYIDKIDESYFDIVDKSLLVEQGIYGNRLLNAIDQQDRGVFVFECNFMKNA